MGEKSDKLLAAGGGIVGSIWGQHLIHDNEQAISIIATVFSILAGFLVAIMAIMGDPGGSAEKSWRALELSRNNIFNQLVRQKWMFTLYLATLGLILISSLLDDKYPSLVVWIEHVYLGTAITAFILSLRLPATLMNIQLSRHEEMIKSKQKSVGIKD